METAFTFRIVAMLIKSELFLGHKQHGELCPQEWVYHYFEFSDSDDDEDFGGRRLAATDDDASHVVGTHLRLRIWKFTGAT